MHRMTVNSPPPSNLNSALFPTDEHGRIILQDPASVASRGKSPQYVHWNDRAATRSRHTSMSSATTPISPTSTSSSHYGYERPHHRHSHSFASGPQPNMKQEPISPVQPYSPGQPPYAQDPYHYAHPPGPGVSGTSWHPSVGTSRYPSVPPNESQHWGQRLHADTRGPHDTRGSPYDSYVSDRPMSSGAPETDVLSSLPSTSYDSSTDLGADQGQGANTGVKRRRRSTQYQLQILNAAYAESRYPSTSVRQELAKKLNMTPRQVQIWFQNKRGYAME